MHCRRPAIVATAFAVLVSLACGKGAPPPDADGAPADPAKQLRPVSVTDSRYTPGPAGVSEKSGRWVGYSMDFGGFALPSLLDKYVVTAARTPQSPERVAATAQLFDQVTLRSTPTATVDEALRSTPSFSLFRRTDSLVANPTTQGVSLRGLGPSGASRSLVLLDGVPLNDPFGGWVNWSSIPRDAVGRIEVVPGGGATAWGNAALGGVVQVLSLPLRLELTMFHEPPQPVHFGYRGTAQFSAMLGDFDTRSVDVAVTRRAGQGVVQVYGEDFATHGFNLIAADRRGPVDVPAWSRHRSWTARWRAPIGASAEVTTTLRGFEEFRGNGTPYQRNGTREKFASVQLAAQPNDAFTWTLTGYAQDQSYASTFSSVNAARTAETPASDQFAVPSTAAGASVTRTWRQNGGATLSAGADVRAVHGETREHYSYSGGRFTRLRVAGGSQAGEGVFAVREQPLTKTLRLTTGVRLDRWEDTNGHRRESDLSTGVASRNDRYAAHEGTEFSPSAGLVWTPVAAWRVHVNGQQAFRRPTLNELYRPFRQGSNVVEANADLRTERVSSAEAGAEWSLRRQVREPHAVKGRTSYDTKTETPLTLGATVFWNDLHDAVSNVTLAHGPGTFPLFGTLPAGGVGRQRLNLDRTLVQGVELSATWQPSDAVSITAAYLYDDATVRRAGIAPDLVGRRLAEVPRHSAAITGRFRLPGEITITPRVRWIDRQFDDDENTLRLGAAVVGDVGISRPLTQHLEVFLNAENIANVRIETARSPDGVVNTGTPRFVFGGIRGKW